MNIRLATSFFVSILIFSIGCFGQDSFETRIYQSYIKGDISTWNKIIDNSPAPKGDAEAVYRYALTHYGFVGYCVYMKDRKIGKYYQQAGMEIADKLLEMDQDDPRFNALKGALYGLQIGLNPASAMIIGRKAVKYVDQALQLNPNSPHALIEEANKLWHIPPIWGGSKDEAIRLYEKAIWLLERDKELIQHNWYYLNVVRTLAMWYEDTGQKSNSLKICAKLVEIEPDFIWAQEKIKENR